MVLGVPILKHFRVGTLSGDITLALSILPSMSTLEGKTVLPEEQFLYTKLFGRILLSRKAKRKQQKM